MIAFYYMKWNGQNSNQQHSIHLPTYAHTQIQVEIKRLWSQTSQLKSFYCHLGIFHQFF